jgi:mannosyltransferase OCH1-like enzyme
MRRGLLIFLLVNLLILSFLIRSVSTLLALLVEDAAADAIHRAELPSPNSSLIEHRPQIIPKIIHQTYKNETIPEVWQDAQKSCIEMHPDYEYIVRQPPKPLARFGLKLANMCY